MNCPTLLHCPTLPHTADDDRLVIIKHFNMIETSTTLAVVTAALAWSDQWGDQLVLFLLWTGTTHPLSLLLLQVLISDVRQVVCSDKQVVCSEVPGRTIRWQIYTLPNHRQSLEYILFTAKDLDSNFYIYCRLT